MILTPALAETAEILANISDDLLPLFPPLERAVIIAVKEFMKRKEESPAVQAGQREHHIGVDAHRLISPITT